MAELQQDADQDNSADDDDNDRQDLTQRLWKGNLSKQPPDHDTDDHDDGEVNEKVNHWG